MKQYLTIPFLAFILLLDQTYAKCEHGVTYTHPLYCRAYLECVYENLIERYCPATLWFNIDLGVCDWPENVNCSVKVDLTTTEKITTLDTTITSPVSTIPITTPTPTIPITTPTSTTPKIPTPPTIPINTPTPTNPIITPTLTTTTIPITTPTPTPQTVPINTPTPTNPIITPTLTTTTIPITTPTSTTAKIPTPPTIPINTPTPTNPIITPTLTTTTIPITTPTPTSQTVPINTPTPTNPIITPTLTTTTIPITTPTPTSQTVPINTPTPTNPIITPTLTTTTIPITTPTSTPPTIPKNTSTCQSDIFLEILYRLYRPITNNHLYTTSRHEADNKTQNSGFEWRPSPGLVATSANDCFCATSLTPVIRLHRQETGILHEDHFYTISESEANDAVQYASYIREFIAFYCTEVKDYCGASLPVYRYRRLNEHVYTTSVEEGKEIIANGGISEGILCYIW